MDKTRRHPATSCVCHPCGRFSQKGWGEVVYLRISIKRCRKIMARDMPDQRFDPVLVLHETQPLKAANADMTV